MLMKWTARACGGLCLLGMVVMGVDAKSSRDIPHSPATGTAESAPTTPATPADPADLARALASRAVTSDHRVQFCFAEGTPIEYMDAFCQLRPELCGSDAVGAPRYNFATRWSGAVGTPRNLTWSLVPDGLPISSVNGSPGSVLFSRMDSLFANNGGRSTWIGLIEQSFQRWADLTGTSYTRITSGGNDWDDGASWGSGSGSSARGDIRIASVFLDGASNTLAFNLFPGNGAGGNMVLDSAEIWDSPASNNFRFFRDVIMHEHGHGLGIEHVCPIIGGVNGRLMEPIINTAIDGPQHDDIRAVQFSYGDAFETNDSPASATDLGVVSIGQGINVGVVPAPSTISSSLTSIHNNGDVDYYRITTTSAVSVSATVTPLGFNYDSSEQDCGTFGGDCCSGNFSNSLQKADLELQVISNNGTTVLASASNNGIGQPETLTNVVLGAPGNYFIRVSETGFPNESQLYRLQIFVNSANVEQAEFVLPEGAPSVLTPGVPTTFPVEIVLNDAEIMPGSESLIYNYGSGLMIAPLVPVGGSIYEATLPAPECGDTVEFSLAASSTVAGSTSFIRMPEDGLTNPFTAVVASTVTPVLSDNGESDQGWSVSGSASDGHWQRGVPAGTGNNGDPTTDADGSGQCWLTDNVAGNSDVDSGSTILTSVPFALSDGDLISYAYWLNDTEALPLNSSDALDVEIATNPAGTNWTLVRHYTTASAAWRTDSIIVGDEVAASSTMRIRFIATDAGAASIVEAGMDAFLAAELECTDLPLPPDAPTAVAATDDQCGAIALSWNPAAGADEYDVYRSTVNDPDGADLLEAGVVGTTYDDTTAAGQTEYFYWVQACNAGGCSDHSAPAAAGLLALPGDMNRDGLIDGLDIQGFTGAILGSFDGCADLASPAGVLDAADVAAFADLLLGI